MSVPASCSFSSFSSSFLLSPHDFLISRFFHILIEGRLGNWKSGIAKQWEEYITRMLRAKSSIGLYVCECFVLLFCVCDRNLNFLVTFTTLHKKIHPYIRTLLPKIFYHDTEKNVFAGKKQKYFLELRWLLLVSSIAPYRSLRKICNGFLRAIKSTWSIWIPQATM